MWKTSCITKKGSCFYPLILFTVLLIPDLFAQSLPDTARFADEINQFIYWDSKNSYPRQAVLFVGSSSIRLWKTHDYFPDFPVINRGFGGSQIADINLYLEYVVLKYQPRIIVFYAGDNDIAGGKPVETVIDDFKKFITAVWEKLPQVPVLYLPIKPSLNRWEFWPLMQQVNVRIKQLAGRTAMLVYVDTANPLLGSDGKPKTGLFREDGLHLNETGYRVWNSILLPYLQKTMRSE